MQEFSYRSGQNTPWKNPKKQTGRRWGKIFLRAFLAIFLIGTLSIAAVFAVVAKDLPSPGKINTRSIAQSSKIFDRTGNHLLYEIHGEEKRTLIPFDQMPTGVKYATIALEDQDFYSHHGIKLSSIARAVLKDISLGGRAQGGSTITQQLIKNSLLTSERTLTRKVKEVILAIEVEQKFSKNEILEMYLNEIPYGSNAYGIQAAAYTFFGKEAKDLSLDESALLASLPQAPSYFSPFGSNTDALKRRQEYALQSMADLKLITQEEADGAKKENVFSKMKPDIQNIHAPHFVMYIKEYLESTYGQKLTQEGGMKVYTTLDWEAQQEAEKIVKEQAIANQEKYRALNASLVAIDPKTGQILAMVGSRDFFDKTVDGQVNVALSDRQPGSSFKPYVYLTAFEKGYTPETYLYDVETNFSTRDGQSYSPQNYSGKFVGPVRMKEALAMSLNIPAVKTLYLAGIKDSILTAKSLGITTLNEPSRYGLSLVLGGGEVKLLDHTASYATLANGGIKYEKTGLLRIEDAGGKILEAYKQGSGTRVVEEKYITMLDHALSTNKYRASVFGENNPLKFDNGLVAVKTGTTNKFRDAWTMGYSSSLAVGVWVGNNSGESMRAGADGSVVAAPIWRKFMDVMRPRYSFEPLPSYKEEDFQKKDGVMLLDGELPLKKNVSVCEIPHKEKQYCIANAFCPEREKKKKDFVEAHSILYYVDIASPRGDAPKKPEKDPQFANWEKGVKAYYKDNKKLITGDVPDKECSAEDFGDFKPSLTISTPDTAGKEGFTISVEPKAPYGIEKITFLINDKEVENKTGDPFDFHYTPEETDNNTLVRVEVILTDKSGNKASARKEVTLSF